MCIGRNNKNDKSEIDNLFSENSKEEVLLGVTIHNKLTFDSHINALSASPTKWSNTLKQFVGKLPTNCLSVFDHFVKLALKG